MRRPVTLTQRNKPRLVLLNIEDDERLTRLADPRRVHTLDSMPDDLFAGFERAVEAYANDTSSP